MMWCIRVFFKRKGGHRKGVRFVSCADVCAVHHCQWKACISNSFACNGRGALVGTDLHLWFHIVSNDITPSLFLPLVLSVSLMWRTGRGAELSTTLEQKLVKVQAAADLSIALIFQISQLNPGGKFMLSSQTATCACTDTQLKDKQTALIEVLLHDSWVCWVWLL